MSLKVQCDNTTDGCKWIGELRSLDEHITSCSFTHFPCPNECKIGDKIVHVLRKDIEKHKEEECPRRQYKCPHCEKAGEYQEMTTAHLEECPMMKVSCRNVGCKEEIARCTISKHSLECMFEVVTCKYANIGCTVKIHRKDLLEHEKDIQLHLELAIDAVHEQQVIIEQQETALAVLQSVLSIQVCTQSTELQKLKSKITMLEGKVLTPFERLMCCTPVTTTPNFSIFHYKFTGFEQHKLSEKDVYSPSFYNSPGGYKMCLKLNVLGTGSSKGTHMSVYVYLMRGENDDHLPWPFTGVVTIELLNQLEDKNHHLKIITFPSAKEVSKRVVDRERAQTGYGRPSYISHSSLGYDTDKNCQYLKDDCLYFKVKAEGVSPKPWLISYY